MFEFKKTSLDNYELHYKDKVLKFKRTVEMGKKLQSIEVEARLEMMKQMTSQGITKNDLIIERIEDGVRKVDESNYIEYEKDAMNMARYNVINAVFKMAFNMDLQELIADIGINENDEASISKLTEQFALIISGKDVGKIPYVKKEA